MVFGVLVKKVVKSANEDLTNLKMQNMLDVDLVSVERGDRWFGDDFMRKLPTRTRHRFREEM